jgi:RNA polymerase sigma-70 factor (ECF subfamily)
MWMISSRDPVIEDERVAQMRQVCADHSAVLWRYAFHLVHDAGKAEDIVQEALLRAWQHETVLDQSNRSARAWLMTVVHNLAVDEYRKGGREVDTDSPPELPALDGYGQVLDQRLVAEALAGLSAEHRDVIFLAYYRGLSTKQIAVELGIPDGTVKSRAHYGLRALRSALQGMGVGA